MTSSQLLFSLLGLVGSEQAAQTISWTTTAGSSYHDAAVSYELICPAGGRATGKV